MASKGKRQTNAKAASPAKKAKVDSTFAGIIETLQNADTLPERCRDMLVAMVAPSLNTPQAERHALQTLGVSMIEETLRGAKENMQGAIDQAKKELSKLEGSRDSLSARVSVTEANFNAKLSTEQAKQSALDEAKKAVADAGNVLGDAQEAERKGDEPLTELRADQATFETLFSEHVKAPMEANEGPHYAQLKPHIPKLDLDDSLSVALPSSCKKKKEQRGHFDDVVLGELQKALAAKIQSIGKAIVEEVPKVAERKAGAVAAQASLEEKLSTEKAAAAQLEAAAAAREEAAAELAKAKDEVSALAPNIEQATNKHGELISELTIFEEGPLKVFETFRDKVAAAAVDGEAASAGA